MVSVLALLVALAALFEAWPKSTESVFNRLAERIPFVNYGDFLSQRTPWPRIDDPMIKVSEKGVQQAMKVAPDLVELSRLAAHPDPKVRTLAMMRLYSLVQPEAFVAIQENMKDRTATFPDQTNFHTYTTFDEKVPVTTENRAVGDLATRMMGSIGFPARWQNADKRQDFQEWSASRLGNPDWLGWYDFLYELASGGSSPVPKERAPKIAALRSLLETRSAAVRAWFWIGLADDASMTPRGDTALATEEEMIAAGKQLGPEAMLAFLRDGSRAGLREPRLDDPARGRRFVISHAGDFFRPQDAAALKEMGLSVAAADADPANASALIRESLSTGKKSSTEPWDRAMAVAAVADLCGDAETDFVVEWFYDTPVDSSRSSDQGVFLSELTRRRPTEWQKTIRALVADTRFESLAGEDVVGVVSLVNQLEGHKAIKLDYVTTPNEVETRNLLRCHFGLPTFIYQHLEPVHLPKQKPRWDIGLESGAHSLAISPDGKTVAVGLQEGGVRLFDAGSGKALGSLAKKSFYTLVRFGKSDGRLLVCDAAGLLSIFSLPDLKNLSETNLNFSGGNECDIHDSVGLIASRGTPGKVAGISVMNLSDGKLRWTCEMPIRGAKNIGFSPDGQRLVASDSFTHDLHLFDPSSPTPITRMQGHSGVPSAAGFSPDGKWLVSVSNEEVRVWDGRTGAPHHQFHCPHPEVVGFTADSKCFLTHSSSRQITAFEILTGKAVAGFDFETGWVSHMLAARDGKRIFMTLEQASRSNFPSGKAPADENTTRPTRLVCWE
jgi:WD40 repeat protein